MWAMATLGHSNLRLCEKVAKEAVRRGIKTFQPQAVSNMVWAFAVLEYNNTTFMTVRAASG